MGVFFLFRELVQIFFLKRFFKVYSNKNFFFKELLIGLLICFIGIIGQSQVIYQHDFGTTKITNQPYTVPPAFFDANLFSSEWTTSVENFSGYYGNGGNPSASLSLSNSSGTPTISLTFQVKGGYQLSITQYNFWRERSPTGAQNWEMSINGTIAGSGSIPTTGASLGNTNVSNIISGLTGTVTISISLSGASGTGTFRLDDFTLIGSVTPIITYYRSRQNGNWATPATWESSTDNTNWNVATSPPTKDAESILIQPGNTVNVASAVSLDQTTIAGTLQLQTGGILNINDGAGDDITIPANGILQVTSSDDYSNSVIQSANANINIATNGKIEIGDGSSSTGDGYEAFATSANNIWNDGAVFEYNNNGVFQIAGSNLFSKFIKSEIPIFQSYRQ